MSDHDNKCEFMLAPPDMNRLGLCLCKERALKARLAEAERLFKLTLRCLTDDEDGGVCHGRIRQFLRTTDADSAADSADIVTVRTSWKELEVARLIRDHQKIIDTKRKSCPRCYGTGAIDAPTSADDPSCPECDGEGHV